MSKHLGPIEIECDAPPYCIVQASRHVGVHSPEDVRWVRLRRFLLDQDSPWWALWMPLQGRNRSRGNSCSCGQPLPKPCRVTFAFDTGGSVSYALGQCLRCRTVFWDEA